MGRAFGFIALLLALAAAVYLFSRQAARSVHQAQGLRLEIPSQLPPQALDWEEAKQAAARLESLAEEPTPPREELAAIAQKAAAWAAGSEPGSAAYRLAVALRAACFELSLAGPEAGDLHRQRAKQELATARGALAGRAPGSVTRGVQDQLKNLQVQRGEELTQGLEQTP